MIPRVYIWALREQVFKGWSHMYWISFLTKNTEIDVRQNQSQRDSIFEGRFIQLLSLKWINLGRIQQASLLPHNRPLCH